MSKYNREIIGLDGTVTTIDVYRVLDAFQVTDPATQHAIKKMLCTGLRGHKDYLTDIDDSIESLQKAKELYAHKDINKKNKRFVVSGDMMKVNNSFIEKRSDTYEWEDGLPW
ncbi:hypothetical protein Sd1_gp60 [Shigella phage Sd1]|uniref:Uncharacterized protein n=1 Tax=Shigella phage Sd1 TaxID=2024313 RepID=A0A291AYM1_9CAUD|nr:ATPase [Shigella phage Sd1]ATE86126.1 hypothetical protein Sd1_gp60 [Shigella phage Sd1]